MKVHQLLTICLSIGCLLSCSNNDDTPKTRISLLSNVEVTFPESSLANYSLAVHYNDDNTIQSVIKTFADFTTMRFTCSYTNTQKLAALVIEPPVGAARTVEFRYAPQDILLAIDDHIEGFTNSYEINYNANENTYSTANKFWFFDEDNNFEGYFFNSESLYSAETNEAKGIENLERYIPMLIYETLNGNGFSVDLNFLSSQQINRSTFEELGPGGTTINYRFDHALNTEGLLSSSTTFVNDNPTIFSIKTYTYEVKFQ